MATGTSAPFTLDEPCGLPGSGYLCRVCRVAKVTTHLLSSSNGILTNKYDTAALGRKDHSQTNTEPGNSTIPTATILTLARICLRCQPAPTRDLP